MFVAIQRLCEQLCEWLQCIIEDEEREEAKHSGHACLH